MTQAVFVMASPSAVRRHGVELLALALLAGLRLAPSRWVNQRIELAANQCDNDRGVERVQFPSSVPKRSR
jgi:hypothetical protein